MFIFTLRQNSSLLIPFNPIHLAGGWGWRLIYIGRAHPLETFSDLRARALAGLRAWTLGIFRAGPP